VNALTDQQLLRDYAEHHSEAAFAELVRRHVDLVHSAALRMVNESHAAEDVTQSVFLALAQNASRLAGHPVLSGWLHTTARHLAAKAVRASVRRQLCEQEAAAMNHLLSAENEAPWEDVAPHLDACLGELNDAERDALLLRYFEKKSAPEIAALLGISNSAAQKRVSRAVERLRDFFAQRGVTIGAGGLSVAISANAVQAAPAGLAVTISAAALAGTAVSTSTVIAATTKTIAMTTLQKAIVTATVAMLAGAGIYEARQAAQLREQNQTLQQQQAPLVEQVQQLQSERDAAMKRLAGMREDIDGLKSNQSELLKLRGEVGVLRRQASEASQGKHVAEQQLAAAMSSEEQFKKHQSATANAAKQVGLALHMFFADGGNQYPTNLTQLAKELGGSFTIGEIDLASFDIVGKGARDPDHTNPKMVALRERLSRQAPDGTWKRIYLFDDGRVQTATSNDGNFDVWERQNTFSPSPN
jgi:RNA polymerase sigma factor (sigma-70 family)